MEDDQQLVKKNGNTIQGSISASFLQNPLHLT